MDDSQEKMLPAITSLTRLGVAILVVFFGVFGLWATFAKLDSAAIAQGNVAVSSYPKTIQHLEGGIIKKIDVENGSKVKQYQALLEIEATQAEVQLQAIKNEFLALLAEEARLESERDGLSKVNFPESLLQNERQPDIAKAILGQIAIFNANNKTFAGWMDILKQRLSQLDSEIAATESQVKAETRQAELINKELEATEQLLKQGSIEKTRYWALQREAARLEGNRNEHLAIIAKARQKIGETQTEILTRQEQRNKEIVEKLQEIHRQLAEKREKMRAAEDVLQRTVIRAPQAGTIINLNVHTIGGVIKPGEPLLEIIPDYDELIIEAQINPLDIDVVKVGLRAKINLMPYKTRHFYNLSGQVSYISANTLIDPSTKSAYYAARIKVNKRELSKLPQVQLYPGMPAQVMIKVGERTPLQYLLDPLKQSIYHAFRET